LLRQLLEAGARHELKCGTEGEVEEHENRRRCKNIS